MLIYFHCFSADQSEEKASIYLNTIHQYPSKKPWVLTFNYGRKLLQSYMLETWNGRVENVRHAQEQLLKRMQVNGIRFECFRLMLFLRRIVLLLAENFKQSIDHLMKRMATIEIISFYCWRNSHGV